MKQSTENQNYDLFKISISFILLILIIILLFLDNREILVQSQPIHEQEIYETLDDFYITTPTVEAGRVEESAKTPEFLPAFPEPQNLFSLEERTKKLLDSQGKAIYQMNEGGTMWVPIIPESLISGNNLTLRENWELINIDGDSVFTWDSDTYSWIPSVKDHIEGGEPQLPLGDCPGALAPRLVSGGKAKVISNLNFRSSPGLYKNNWIRTNPVGTILVVLGDTECTSYDFGSYRWWKVEMENGDVGWSAEGSATGSWYFLEPYDPSN